MDISNTFLQVKMMARIDPALYREYVTYSANRVLILYMRLAKAFYGMLRAALLFYKRLQITLEDTRLKLTHMAPVWPRWR